MSDTTDIFKKCTPAIRLGTDPCDTMTGCNVSIPTPSILETMYKGTDENGATSQWRVMEALFMQLFELGINQVRQTPFQKFIMANRVDVSRKISIQPLANGLDRIMPYIQAWRPGLVNNVYWRGVCTNATGPVVAMYSPTNIPTSANWFNVGEVLYMEGLKADGTSTKTAWKVASIGNATTAVADGYVTVTLTTMNNGSFLPAARVTAPLLNDQFIVRRGTNNVSDWESYCQQPPGVITGNFEQFWFQTSRTSTCQNDLYEEYRSLILANNPLYAKFFDLPLVEYNRQIGTDWLERMATAMMWQKPLCNQTVENLQWLEDIETGDIPYMNSAVFTNGSKICIGKRANAIGWYEQHAQKGRVVDMQGGKLSIPSLQNSLYRLQQLREDTGSKNPNVFELLMPSTYAPVFQQAMLQYFKSKGEGMLRINMDLQSKLNQDTLGFQWRSFQLDWPNVEIRVVTDRYFDHYMDMARRMGVATGNTAWENIGRQIWIMDWSRNYTGILGSNRVVNKSGGAEGLRALALINQDLACRMKMPSKTTTLSSVTWATISELPEGDLILENFSNEIPSPDQVIGDYDEIACAEPSCSSSSSPWSHSGGNDYPPTER